MFEFDQHTWVPLFMNLVVPVAISEPHNGMSECELFSLDDNHLPNQVSGIPMELGFIDPNLEARYELRALILELLRGAFISVPPCNSEYHLVRTPFDALDKRDRLPSREDYESTYWLLTNKQQPICAPCRWIRDSGTIPDLGPSTLPTPPRPHKPTLVKPTISDIPALPERLKLSKDSDIIPALKTLPERAHRMEHRHLHIKHWEPAK